MNGIRITSTNDGFAIAAAALAALVAPTSRPEMLQANKESKTIWAEYAPAIKTLEGAISIETKLGPPNYGQDPKHDKRVRIHVLRLAIPLDSTRL